jgi:translation initiation factor RLI1
MGNKRVVIDFKKCSPQVCAPDSGICPACSVCTHKLLVQEDPNDAPMLISERMCVGCGDCVLLCPCGALTMGSNG